MDLENLIKQNNIEPHRVMSFKSSMDIDLSKDNPELAQIDLNDEHEFTSFIFDQIQSSGMSVAIGGYGEERALYNRSDLFEGEEPRTIHLGIDIWDKAGSSIYSPLKGVIHSYDNREVHGDYGPVIILEHQIGGHTLYSLFGHLALRSLENKSVGQLIEKGEEFAWLGEYRENYHWPPHLHFQLMWDLEGNEGDYPGVCKKSESDHFLQNCPNPAIFL